VISGYCRPGSGYSPLARLGFYTRFTPAFYRPTTVSYLLQRCRSPNDGPATDAICFLSRYFRFRPGGEPRAFRVNIRVDYLGPILLGREQRVIAVDLDWATTSGRDISASGGSKGRRRHDNRLASGCNKTRFSMDFNGKYTELH